MLTLLGSGNSILDLGSAASSSTVAFANSSVFSWNGSSILKVYDWNGVANVGGGADHIYVGLDVSGLTPTQLSQIQFYSDAGFSPIGSGANILSSGEVVATPEPTLLSLIGFGALGLMGRRRRRQR